MQNTPASEILFSNQVDSRRVGRYIEEGKLRRLYPGVYTANVDAPIESVVRRNWATIVGYLLPNGVLALRSALEQRPVDGILYVSRGQRRRTIEMPGLTVKVVPERPPVLEGPATDLKSKGLYFPSEARGFLDNLAQTRGVEPRTLPVEELEARLDKILTIRGDYKLNELRDRARILSGKLGMPKEFAKLDGMIGALLGTHQQKKLHSKQALARAAGRPYDPDRLEQFDALHAALVGHVFNQPADPAPTGHALENFAFFEAYFSNFIEGTTFEVEEAEQIIFEGIVIADRPEDSHDIMGTFQAVMAAPWRSQPAQSAEEFLDWLKSVNALVMQARPDKNPGQWKEKANQAGNSLFVLPELVPGTLREGYARVQSLQDPVARALMTMFVVTEVHPFRDGNGRTARLAMNCELSAGGVSRIMIPTVYREDYLLPLKRLSNTKEAGPYVRCMERAQDWSSGFDYNQPREDLKRAMKRCNAFAEDLKNYKLIFP